MLHAAPRGGHWPDTRERPGRRLALAVLLVAALSAATFVSDSASRSGGGAARPLGAGGPVAAPRHAADSTQVRSTRRCGSEAALRTVAGIVCVHGNDVAFGPGSLHAAGQDPGGGARRPIPCKGDGRSGNRIAVYYAYIAGHANRIAEVRWRIRVAIEQANNVVYRSARQTHGVRALRVLTTRKCRPVVRSLRLPRAAVNSFGRTIDAASAAGLDATNRKYILFVDSDALCGVATLRYDSRPGPENANNVGPSWARLDRGCWSGFPAAHEIFHMLGSVQPGAPHFDNTGHCTDDRDLMCYQNQGGKRVYIRCRPALDDRRLDCGKDDYFNTAPRPRSYLARHWNTARSSFLYYGGPALPALPGKVPAPKVTMSSLTAARVTWSAPAHSRVSRYELMKNGLVVWHGTARYWDDAGASAGTGNYQVRAVNLAGSGAWSPTVDALLPAPPAPDSVTLTSPISVSWTADASFVQAFQLYGVLDDGTTRYISSWPPTAQSATDNTLSLWRSWSQYRVCAYNETGSACRDATT